MKRVIKFIASIVVLQQSAVGAPSISSTSTDEAKCIKSYKTVIKSFENNPQTNNTTCLSALSFEGAVDDLTTHSGILRCAFSNDATQLALAFANANHFERSVKRAARENVRSSLQSSLKLETKLLLDLEEIIDKQMESRSEKNKQAFLELISTILKNNSERFDVLRKLFKEDLISDFIYQFHSGMNTPKTISLKELNVLIADNTLLDELQRTLLAKYEETLTMKNIANNILSVINTPPFLALAAIVIANSYLPENALANIKQMTCPPQERGEWNGSALQNLSGSATASTNISRIIQNVTCTFAHTSESPVL